MQEVLEDLMHWWRKGDPVAIATVVDTFASAPRPPGASMLVGPQGQVVGSVSGGCVESAVYDVGREVMRSGQPTLERYGVSDASAFSVGLTCGGTLDVLVERVDRDSFPGLAALAEDVAAGRPVAVATLIRGGHVGSRLVLRPDDKAEGTLGSDRLDAAVADDALGLLASGRSETLHYGPDGQRLGTGTSIFVSSFTPRPRMIIFGAIDFAAAMASLGTYLGHRVTVCDARGLFATETRFPDVDEVVVDWPHRYLEEELVSRRVDDRTVVCVLTHDPKFDLPLLQIALDADLAYVGAMGSRTTHENRLQGLRELGCTEEQLSRLHSPIGLDLGARTPQETAVSIAAEIIASKWGGAGQPLRTTRGPIHR